MSCLLAARPSRSGRTVVVTALAVSWVLLICACGGAPRASAGGTRDVSDGWLLPAGELIARLWPPPENRGSGPLGATATGQQASLAHWLWLGHARLYEMPQLPLLAVGLGLPALGLQWSLQWQRLGQTLVQEDQWRLAVRGPSRLEPTLSVGWDRLALAGRSGRGHLFLGAGISLRTAAGLRLRIEPPLTPPPPWYGPTAARRWLLITGGLEGVVWGLAVDRTTAGSPVVQLDLTGRVGPRAALGLRAEPVTGSVGLTTAWYHRNWLLRTSHLIHPELGVTHRWYLAAGSVGSIR